MLSFSNSFFARLPECCVFLVPFQVLSSSVLVLFPVPFLVPLCSGTVFVRRGRKSVDKLIM